MKKNFLIESLEKELLLVIHWICFDEDRSLREMFLELKDLGFTSRLRYGDNSESECINKIKDIHQWIITQDPKSYTDYTTHPFYDIISQYAQDIYEKHISEILNKSFILKIPKVVFPEEEKKKSLSFWDWLNTPVFINKKK